MFFGMVLKNGLDNNKIIGDKIIKGIYSQGINEIFLSHSDIHSYIVISI